MACRSCGQKYIPSRNTTASRNGAPLNRIGTTEGATTPPVYSGPETGFPITSRRVAPAVPSENETKKPE